jgi:hypothetical protein
MGDNGMVAGSRANSRMEWEVATQIFQTGFELRGWPTMRSAITPTVEYIVSAPGHLLLQKIEETSMFNTVLFRTKQTTFFMAYRNNSIGYLSSRFSSPWPQGCLLNIQG